MNPITIAWLAAILAVGAGGFYFGRQSIEVHDLKTEVKRDASNAKQTADEITTTHEEAKTYADAVAKASAAPDPAPAVMCVRRYTIVQSSATGGVDHGGGGLPAGNPGPLPAATESASADIGKPATEIGARANAQVAALKHYIEHVCLAPAPK